MSNENVARFMQRVLDDEDLGDTVGRLEGDGGPESVRRLIEVAEQAGYTFTAAELYETFRGMARGSSAELSDDQLHRVAGGSGQTGQLVEFSLQTYMQRFTTSNSLLSNVLNAQSDTSSQISKNMK